jgi:hypothetical protein
MQNESNPSHDDGDAIYRDGVQRLRVAAEISNFERANPRRAEQFEDVAIRQVARLAWEFDYTTASEAIDEADAEWLHQVVWERAERAVRARDLDAWKRDVQGDA